MLSFVETVMFSPFLPEQVSVIIDRSAVFLYP